MSEQGTDDFAAFVPHQEVEDPGIVASASSSVNINGGSSKPRRST
jgi:hypothetical protein